MNTANSHPAFDPEESKILSSLVPEGPNANEPLGGLPSDPTSAPADAAVAPTTATPADAGAAQTATAAPAATTSDAASAAPTEAASGATATGTTESATATQETAAPAAPATQGGDTKAALRASRHAEKRLRDENARLVAELEEFKRGNGPVNTKITDEELAALETDFPLQAKIVKQQRELERQIAETKTAQAPEPEFVPVSYAPEIQSLIDDNPDLLAWQYDPKAQDKFARAIQYDAALQRDPDWSGKPMADRFIEAARRTKAAFASAAPAAGSSAPTATPTPTPAAAPAAPRIDPAAAIAAAPSTGPKGISDFRGGATGQPPSINFAGMTDEQIMASLPQG